MDVDLRDNWRIILLVVLVVLSGIALFAPGGGAQNGPAAGNATGSTGGADGGTGNATTGDVAGGNVTAANGTAGNATGNGTGSNATEAIGTQIESGGLTNLQFGLQLSGGTRLRADLVGVTASNVPMAGDEQAEIERTVAEELGLDQTNVTVRVPAQAETGTVELFTGRYDAANDTGQIRDAIGASGVDTSGVAVSDGVTQQTWDSAERTLRDKINQGGLTGGTVSTITTPTGENFLVVEVPNADREAVLDLVGDQGQVQIVATWPEEADNGTTVQREETVLIGEELTRISPPSEGEGSPPYVSVSVLEGEPAEYFAQVMNERGFTQEGVSDCQWSPNNTENPGYCLKTIVDGETVYAAGLAPNLAQSIRGGSWVNTRGFRLETTTFGDAQELQIHLNAGALPTDLDIQSQVFLQPSLAQKFKPLALLTGIVAWIVVSGVIFWRYREIRVAVPMLLTAFAEVWILLGFAVGVGLALDLSHIAGLIAVIGTGVDDLVIIADEIMQRGDIATDRVFKNRFRKAFWVIGAAAITTIIAMSPLAVLSLGDLQGFAIITIVGVLIGVLITRPAYGDILRNLLLVDES